MLTVRLTEDLKKLTEAIGDVGTRHIPRSTAIALTKTAAKAKDNLIAAMSTQFDRPTRFTLNSLWTKAATVSDPVAEVKVKEWAPKGTPAIKYLAPGIYGGQRRLKRFERALQAAGKMPVGWYAVPTSAVPLDGNGNVPASYIVKMIAQLRSFGEQGYKSNETDRTRKRRLKRNPREGDLFVLLQPKGKLKPGIYRRYHFGMGSAVKPLFIYTRTPPSYSKRFTFFEITNTTIEKEFAAQFVEAFTGALTRWGR